jgi:alkanesulfonate monooxygenase SsuD/methylene tetrahydromethanopterin reductase-like flavin-dependent oxidoreductase (luciferase family)
MRLGLALPHYDFSFPQERRATVAAVVDYARRAETLGFDSVWVSDHLFLDLVRYGGTGRRYPSPEAMTMLTAIGLGTSRIRLGALVLCSSFRQQGILAAQARAIDELSGGRLVLGMGSGWYEPEFEAAGMAFGTVGTRIDQLAETAGFLRANLPSTVPLWVGSKGRPKMAQLIAEHADGWNLAWRVRPDAYRDRLAILHERCRAVGRSAESVRLSVGLYCLLARDERDLQARFESLRRWTPGGALADITLAKHSDGALVGTVDACAAQLRELEALGVEEVVLAPASLPFAIYDDEQLALIADELRPRVT